MKIFTVIAIFSLLSANICIARVRHVHTHKRPVKKHCHSDATLFDVSVTLATLFTTDVGNSGGSKNYKLAVALQEQSEEFFLTSGCKVGVELGMIFDSYSITEKDERESLINNEISLWIEDNL